MPRQQQEADGGHAPGPVPRRRRQRQAEQQRRHRPWRMAAVCLLLLAGHVVHLWWAVRPDAPLARPNPLLDAAVLGVLGPCWAGWWWAGMRRGAGARGSIATAPDPAAVRPARGTAH